MKHKGEYENRGYMLDGWKCSCGWRSDSYFDGGAYAESEWKKHIEKEENNNDNLSTQAARN